MKTKQVIVVMKNDFVECVLSDKPGAEARADLPEQVKSAISVNSCGSVAIDPPKYGGRNLEGERRVYWHWDVYDVVG